MTNYNNTNSALTQLPHVPSTWYIFPCKAGQKEPAVALGFKAASNDPAQITAWKQQFPGCNWGVDCDRSGLFVVDIDSLEGEEAWAELQIEHGAQDTLCVRTPRGGHHHYFTGAGKSSVQKLGVKIDTRSLGGYVLLPGSVVNGKAYVVERETELAPAPAWAVEMAGRQREKAQARENFVLDQPHNVERARSHLNNLVKQNDVAVEYSGGDNKTIETINALFDLGVSQEVAFDLLQERWNPACVPPWDADELKQKIDNALASRQNEVGAWAVARSAETFGDALAALIREGAMIKPETSGPIKFDEVIRRVVPPVQEVVQGLVERGTVTFLSAPGGSHKSRLALQWGLCVGTGTPIFGRSVERSHFLYLSYEDHPDEVARRAQAICAKLSLPMSAGEYWDFASRDAPLAIVHESGQCDLLPTWDLLREHLAGITGHKFIVIDGCYNALRFEGAAKINETSVMAGISLLQRLCAEADATILILWHPSQAGQERGDASGWSVAWHNAPRARLSLSPVKDTDSAFDLKVEKRNHGRKGDPITLHWNEGALLPISELAGNDRNELLIQSVVRVALMAAETGAPINRKTHLNKWQLDEIHKDMGRRPTQREAKDALASALLRHVGSDRGRLRYLSGTRHRAAGYYPPDEIEAEALAEAARDLSRATEN